MSTRTVTARLDGSGLRLVAETIELSATTFCTVTGNLASGVAEIHHAYIVRDTAGEEHYGEVVVTGPYASLEALGTSGRTNAE